MNKIVAAWRNHHDRERYSGPDSVKLDDDGKVLLENKMPQDKEPNKALLPEQLNNIIRAIKKGDDERAQFILTKSVATLERLGRERDESRARKKMPEGSDQIKLGSLLAWMDSIEPKHKKAIRQVIMIDATAFARINS